MTNIPAAEPLLRDLRYALRILRASPGFTAAVVCTLAIAIGINTAVFTVVDAVLLRPLPYPDPERLGLVRSTINGSGEPQTMTSQHGVTWVTVRDHATTITPAVFSTWPSGVNVVAAGGATFAQQQRVGAGYFSVLGVSPLRGREFTAAEDRRGGPLAVMLSHSYWRTLGSDPGLVGQTVTVRGEPHLVVGIMPPGFENGVTADLWTPLRAVTDGEGEGENYQILLRLREGFTWAQADDELNRLGGEIARLRAPPPGTTVSFASVELQDGMTTDMRRPILLVWLGVGVVLLVACVNIAGLQLTQSMRRTREIATRIALGSRPADVIRQLAIESVLLAAAGAGAGLLASRAVLSALSDTPVLERLGIWQALDLDARTVFAAAGLALASALIFGIGPAWRASRLHVRLGLAAAGGRTIAGSHARWPRRLIVVTQVALGVVLLSGAALLVRTFTHLRGLEPGFDSRGVVTTTISMEDARYRAAGPVVRLASTTLERLAQSPAVESAGVALGLPYERILNLGFRHLDGPHARDTRGRMASATYIAGEYFQALRIPLHAGRLFDPRDTSAAPGVVVINETFAREYFGGNTAVGSRIALAGREREVIGIVGDVQLKPGFGDRGPLAAMPLAYIPLSQTSDGFLRLVHGWFSPSFVVKTRDTQAAIVPVVRQAVDAADPLLPFAQVRSLDDVRADALALPKVLMWLVLALAGTAAFLAALGIHGLILAAVNERTRELGIRLALGSTTARAIRTLAVPGIVLAVVGTLGGAFIARLGATALRSFVWGVSPADPSTYAVVGLLFVSIAAFASVVPALRVFRIDPSVTLRQE